MALIKMDLELYTQLTHYLTNLAFPTEFTAEQRAAVKRKSHYFIVMKNQLYKKNKKEPNNLFKVLKKGEVNKTLYHLHEDTLAEHFSTEETFRKTKNRYY